MLSWDDCIALCALNEAEIEAIAEHEHIPAMAALELGNYLCCLPTGEPAIRRMILDDLEAARARGDGKRRLLLLAALRHFIATHPKCREHGGVLPFRAKTQA